MSYAWTLLATACLGIICYASTDPDAMSSAMHSINGSLGTRFHAHPSISVFLLSFVVVCCILSLLRIATRPSPYEALRIHLDATIDWTEERGASFLSECLGEWDAIRQMLKADDAEVLEKFKELVALVATESMHPDSIAYKNLKNSLDLSKPADGAEPKPEQTVEYEIARLQERDLVVVHLYAMFGVNNTQDLMVAIAKRLGAVVPETETPPAPAAG
jgi:hypothetical protein